MATATSSTKREARRCEKRQADRERLASAVESLMETDGWARWNTTRRAFRRYSFNNQLLIALQKPDATRITGYKSWEKVGRKVKRGEKAIRILAPRTFVKDVEKPDGGTKTERHLYFVSVPVFDVDQTEGEDLPTITKPIRGASHAEYVETLIAFAGTLGFTVEVRPVEGSASGFCDPIRRLIVVDASLEPNSQLSVLVHEVAHGLGGITYKAYSREDAEVIVEAAAWLVCGSLGLDTSASSIGYIASWCRGQSTEQLRTHAATIDKIARQIETALLGEAEPAC